MEVTLLRYAKAIHLLYLLNIQSGVLLSRDYIVYKPVVGLKMNLPIWLLPNCIL